MQPFDYERPKTVEDAVALLSGDGARPLAGGTDLVAQLRERRKAARRIVDIKHVPEIVDIASLPDGGWRVGAAASIARLGAHAAFAEAHPGLLAAGRLIGSLQIQSRASLGGNLLNAAPSADAVPLLISLAAKAEIAGPGGRRTMAVEEIPVGPGRNALAPGELLVAFHLPQLPPRAAARYLRFTPRREMDIAIAGSGAFMALDENGAVAAARITLASVAPVPMVAARAAAALVGQRPTPERFVEAGRLAAAEARPISDTRASAEYRRDLVAVLTRRALEACATALENEGSSA